MALTVVRVIRDARPGSRIVGWPMTEKDQKLL